MFKMWKIDLAKMLTLVSYSDVNIADQLRECASEVPFPDVSEAPLRVRF